MEPKPLVSFIVPFYNDGITLQKTIESIFKQTYQKFEIWVINDGSTDDKSIAVLESLFGKPKINILHQDNAGPSVARNNAIKHAKGEIIVPLDADDLIVPDALEKALILFQQDPSVEMIYGDLRFFGEKNDVKKQAVFSLEKQFLFNQIAVCAFLKKSVFDKVGYYDAFLSKPGLEDWEFWLRAALQGVKFKKVDDVFFEIRVNARSRTFQTANKNINSIKEYVYKKHAVALASAYEQLFYQKKMLGETPDYRIGNRLLKPWRFLKSAFKK